MMPCIDIESPKTLSHARTPRSTSRNIGLRRLTRRGSPDLSLKLLESSLSSLYAIRGFDTPFDCSPYVLPDRIKLCSSIHDFLGSTLLRSVTNPSTELTLVDDQSLSKRYETLDSILASLRLRLVLFKLVYDMVHT